MMMEEIFYNEEFKRNEVKEDEREKEREERWQYIL